MENALDTEEGLRKAEALFSKKFIEYLTNKKSSTGSISQSPFSRSYDPSILSLHSKDGLSMAPSSDETSGSESSKKPSKKSKKKLKEKSSYKTLNFNYTVRSKLIQCSLIKEAEEVIPPEELKPLLANMTVLLQELKQSTEGTDSLTDLLSRITILVTEFIRRPLKKIQDNIKGEHAKNLEKTSEALIALLNEYKNGPGMDIDTGIRNCKKMEKELSTKEQQISVLKKKLAGERTQPPKVSDMEQRVKNSILQNEKLKAEIKFNQRRVKKYKKILLEKEWTKHKLETDLINFKKKTSKGDVTDSESLERQIGSPEPSIKNETLKKIASPRKLHHSKSKKGKNKTKSTVRPK